MSQQLDELMHIHVESEEEKEAAQIERAERNARMHEKKAHLRLLQDLEKTPGYQLLMAQLTGETEQALITMERADTPLQQSKAVGAYCALLNTVRLVGKSITELSEELNNPQE